MAAIRQRRGRAQQISANAVRRRCALVAAAIATALFASLDVTAGEGASAGGCARRAFAKTDIIAVPCNERLAGDWGGVLEQDDGKTYRVEVSLSEGAGTVHYSSLECSGTLDYQMRRTDTYVYTETITKNTKACVSGGEVELTFATDDGSALDFRWTGDGPTVFGRISGVLKAGVTIHGETTTRPNSDGVDECFRYLPNRGMLVAMACK